MISPLDSSSRLRPAAIAAAILAAVALWAYWPTLADMAWRWGEDPSYSHGYLVPAFAVYLLWMRRRHLLAQAPRPTSLGLLLLGGAVALRLAGAYFHYSYLDQVSLLPCIAGLMTLAMGRAALAWSWPAIAFLAFMVPLPYTLSMALSGPMQGIATAGSTFLLQALGRPAIAEGNLIQLNEVELNIVEACSGLRMLVVFFALSAAVAMLVRKPLWEKLVVAGSAIPIALVANVLRITFTGLLCEVISDAAGRAQCHDWLGYLMMPIGLIFLGLECLVLKKLLIEPASHRSPSSQAAVQRVEVNAASLYGGVSAPRRRRRSVAVPAATLHAADPERQAPVAAEPASESVAQS
jgi:exosortase